MYLAGYCGQLAVLASYFWLWVPVCPSSRKSSVGSPSRAFPDLSARSSRRRFAWNEVYGNDSVGYAARRLSCCTPPSTAARKSKRGDHPFSIGALIRNPRVLDRTEPSAPSRVTPLHRDLCCCRTSRLEAAELGKLGRAELREAGFADLGKHAPGGACSDEHAEALFERGDRGSPQARAWGHRVHLISDCKVHWSSVLSGRIDRRSARTRRATHRSTRREEGSVRLAFHALVARGGI
jgi:hypothetical protein